MGWFGAGSGFLLDFAAFAVFGADEFSDIIAFIASQAEMVFRPYCGQ
jgi:hypothetical protein